MPAISALVNNKHKLFFIIALLICTIFFIAYGVLAVVRHDHYQSFGYDLGINDQTVWRYSIFQAPLNTIHPYPDKTKLYAHVELVYALISPFYWIWSSRKMLLLLEVAFVCLGGIAVYLLAQKRNLSYGVSIATLVSYLGFFGVQNALWFDVHSASFGAAFLMWFLYFLDRKKRISTIVFFLLAITSKENFAFITLVISLFYFIKRKDQLSFFLIASSFAYLFFIFFVYFPHIIHFRYLYQNQAGLLSNFNPLDLINTNEKLQTLFYTVFAFGFIPLLNPLTLIPALADITTYFVIGSDLPGAQGIYMHYRITLAPLLAWATILTIYKYKMLNTNYIAGYLILSTLIIQYTLHLPLSYLTKHWFWQEPSGVKNINSLRNNYLPKNASVVAQNNIVPHISHRDKIYSLYPEKKQFMKSSPCGEKACNWFRWYNHPEFLFVDTSPEWDARHLLTDRDKFIDGLKNLENAGVIKKYKQEQKAVLYKVLKQPEDYK